MIHFANTMEMARPIKPAMNHGQIRSRDGGYVRRMTSPISHMDPPATALIEAKYAVPMTKAITDCTAQYRGGHG